MNINDIHPRKEGQHVENNWHHIEEWMKDYGDRLVRSLTIMTKDEEEAQDIAQEVFIKAYQAQANFRHESSPYTYLYVIALNMVRSRKRSLKKRPVVVQLQENEHTSPYPSPESHVVRHEEHTQTMRAVRNLSPKLRTIVSLFYISEIPIQEISEILGISEGTVKSRLFRARNQLKRFVVQEEHHGTY
jgi:RNA polymerase sigma-70 factor, ECF subfamily